MLDLAWKAILGHSSLADRVDVIPLGSEKFHAVANTSLLHHMCDPLDLKGEFARWPRLELQCLSWI